MSVVKNPAHKRVKREDSLRRVGEQKHCFWTPNKELSGKKKQPKDQEIKSILNSAESVQVTLQQRVMQQKNEASSVFQVVLFLDGVMLNVREQVCPDHKQALNVSLSRNTTAAQVQELAGNLTTRPLEREGSVPGALTDTSVLMWRRTK